MTDEMSLVCPELLTEEGGRWQLMGNRCAECKTVFFPAATGCSNCCAREFERFPLGSSGTLWSWTIQNFLPKAPYDSGETPADFQPYGVGYIEMACGIKVESRLTLANPERLVIGLPMELQLLAYRHDAAGKPFYTYAFAPAGAAR
ncbi:MAG TPA: OB-fold domain-containing protein [Pseudomonadales bacterium]|nr:OB-fold domain-containing protein [Pseudomonadales bacterium]